MEINPIKSKAISFTRARVKKSLNYSLRNTVVPEVSSCKCFGIVVGRRFNWGWSS
jgi:hypothetical protein